MRAAATLILKLDKYILKKYIKTFFLALALIIVIVITFDISEKLDDFLHNHAPLSKIIFQYYFSFIPQFVNTYSPLFIFISVLFFTSKMASNSEIIAILGSGISYRRLLRPYTYGSVIVALIVLILGNFVIPATNQTLIDFESHYIKTVRRSYYSNVHFQAAPHTQVFAESFDLHQNIGYKFCKDIYDDDGHLLSRSYADQIVYDSLSDTWEAHGYYKRTINGLDEHLSHSYQAKLKMALTPADFSHSKKHITEMNTFELMKHIRREELRGSGAVTASKIELYQRLLNPLAVVVMTFIGVAVSSRKTRGGVGLHLAIGISIAFAFVVFMKVTTVFATNSNLSPFLAVLLPQLIFGIAAAFLIKTAPK